MEKELLSISENRDAVKYTRKEQCMRVLWSAGRMVFRLTPRPCFGIRRQILRLFGATVGKNVNLYPSTHVYFPWNLEIKDWSSVGEWALIYNLGKVVIGSRVTVSQRVHLCAGTHDYRTRDMKLLKQPIEIGDDSWICADAFVGPGVHVGEGAIVGACSVAVRDIPPWMIAVGNPAKPVKVRPRPMSPLVADEG